VPQITVHHLENSRSTRILWLLEELEVPYEVKVYARDPRTSRAPVELRDLHPLGKAPVVTVDGLVLAESGAILEHLVDGVGQGRLRPDPGTPQAVQCRYWLHFAEGSLMPPLLLALIFGKLRRAKAPFFIKPVITGVADKVDAQYTSAELERLFGFVEQHLGQHPWFAGPELSIADVQMSYPVEAGLVRARLDGGHPNIDAWLARIHERPAYQRALARGGPIAVPL